MERELGLLIHYGSKKFNRRKFESIKNDWVKPKGGLWASPVNSEWSWKHWCEYEQFRECNEDNNFTFSLKEDSRIYIIDSLIDLKKSPQVNFGYKNYLNFETIAESFDAIWLTAKGQNETHLSHPLNLYGWDCESVLILNKDCIVVNSLAPSYN